MCMALAGTFYMLHAGADMVKVAMSDPPQYAKPSRPAVHPASRPPDLLPPMTGQNGVVRDQPGICFSVGLIPFGLDFIRRKKEIEEERKGCRARRGAHAWWKRGGGGGVKSSFAC